MSTNRQPLRPWPYRFDRIERMSMNHTSGNDGVIRRIIHHGVIHHGIIHHGIIHHGIPRNRIVKSDRVRLSYFGARKGSEAGGSRR